MDLVDSRVFSSCYVDKDFMLPLTVKRYRSWEKDYFTSSMFTPQRGPFCFIKEFFVKVRRFVNGSCRF